MSDHTAIMFVDSDQVQVGSELRVYRELCRFPGRGIWVCEKMNVADATVTKMLENGEAEISTTTPVQKHDFLEYR